jgi:hypothetical protein
MVQWGRPLFPALARAAHMGAGAELDVLVAQPGELGDPKAGLDSDGQQGVVASAGPGLAVGAFDQSLDFGAGQVGDLPTFSAFGGDVQHRGDEAGVFGVAQGCVVEERADGGPAGVSGAYAVFSFGLQVLEETADEGGVEIGQVETVGGFAGSDVGVAQQEPPGVAVGGDGVGAGPSLADEAFGVVGLEGGGERAHGRPSFACWRRPAARASSSGEADRYQ